MKVKTKSLNDKERIEVLDALYTAAGAVRGRDAMKLFLRDLLTGSERIMLGRRILIARRLLGGESAASIAKSMKVGLDTIYRVQRWLEDQLPGYERAIQEMEKEFAKRRGRGLPRPAGRTFGLFRKKYPRYSFLFSSAPGDRKGGGERKADNGR